MESTKHQQYNKIAKIILNQENEDIHMESIKSMIDKFEDLFKDEYLTNCLNTLFKIEKKYLPLKKINKDIEESENDFRHKSVDKLDEYNKKHYEKNKSQIDGYIKNESKKN